MATFDQLSDEQRAIVELVLRQGKTYGELSGMLGIPESRVRERACEALVRLAPVTVRGVEADWREPLVDYVLCQQAGPELTATRGHLRRSEAARSWTRSLLDSLEHLYADGEMPAVSSGGRSPGRSAAVPRPPGPTGSGAPRNLVPGSGRRAAVLAVAGLVAVAAVAVLLWPVGVLTGGDSDDGSGGSGSGAQANSASSTGREDSTERQGSATIARQKGKKTKIYIQIEGLEQSTNRSGYAVWLYNSASDRRSLGAAATDEDGNLQVAGNLPAGYRKYRYIDVTSVDVTGQGNSQQYEYGPSLLRGRLQMADQPTTTGTGKNKATVLAQVSLRP